MATFAPDLTRSQPLDRDPQLLAWFAAWHQHRDADAREQLVHRYLPLACSLARRYVQTREPIDDLRQVASYGLLHAIDRFEPDRGLAFSSFAVPTILGELRHYLRDCGWMLHVPRRAQERAAAVDAALVQLTNGAQREPSTADLADHLSWDIDDVLDGVQAGSARRCTSLDVPIDADQSTVSDIIGAEDPEFDRVDDQLTVTLAARHLPWHAREILHLRFVDGLSQDEISTRLGIPQIRVSRILRASLATLRRDFDIESYR